MDPKSPQLKESGENLLPCSPVFFFWGGKIKSGYVMLRALQKEGSFSFRDRSCSGKGDVYCEKILFLSKTSDDYLNYILKTNGYVNGHCIIATSIHSM
jgi:hypothetical protein